MDVICRTVLSVLVLSLLAHCSFSQQADSTKVVRDSVGAFNVTNTGISVVSRPDSSPVVGHFAGAVSVTNNGISLIPTFSLGKPAVIFDMSVGGRRLSFDPQLRFSLEGKPWTFLFWWRYKLINTNRLRMSIGAHPALNFRTLSVTINGEVNEIMETRRFLAGELAPNYVLTKNVSVGAYYLYARGFDRDATRNTHFITLNSNFSNIRLTNQLFLQIAPQVFYLKLDEADGFYMNATVTLVRKNFPISLSAIVNQVIKTSIVASKDLVWNATLVYSFNKNYVRM